MIQIGNVIVSFEVIEKRFVCDLKKCKGACCVLGDSGAPLAQDEIEILERNIANIKPYLSKEGYSAIEKQGSWTIDADGDRVTPLIDGKECAYSFVEDGISRCGIEKAFLDKAIKFRKPISCYLYPIRLSKFNDFEAVNYQEWEICNPAVALGKNLNTATYVFLKEPLIKKYGKKWFKLLSIAAKEFTRSSG